MKAEARTLPDFSKRKSVSIKICCLVFFVCNNSDDFREIFQEESRSSGAGRCSRPQDHLGQSLLAVATFGKISAKKLLTICLKYNEFLFQGWSRNGKETCTEIPPLLVPRVGARKKQKLFLSTFTLQIT